jgi:hypothetical protein
MLESTITLPYPWGRTVGKVAKTEPSKSSLTIGVAAAATFNWESARTWHVIHTSAIEKCRALKPAKARYSDVDSTSLFSHLHGNNDSHTIEDPSP